MRVQPGRSAGRFAEATDGLLERLNNSTAVDLRLWPHDLVGSRVHARMLRAVGLLSADDLAAIERGLEAVEAEFAAGSFALQPADEDVHMAVERRLTELIGEPARRLHTGRSRNDQVMVDSLLWLRDDLDRTVQDLAHLAGLLLERAEHALEVPMPLYTHYQPAQVGSVGFWLVSHAAAACRQLRRATDLAARLDECPLGAGAVGGGYLPLDRALTAHQLGFARPSPNALYATASRSDLLDAVALFASIGVDLSRLGEELVLFTSPAYGFLRLPDRLCTGSSLLPHKRNPDGAELLRSGGKLAAGEFAALASVTSGLLGGYSKDLQHDKALLFAASDRTHDLIALAALHVAGVELVPDRLAEACAPALAALYLADRLVLSGMSFREAHHVVGQAARVADETGTTVQGALAGVVPPALVTLAAELATARTPDLLAGLRTAGSASPESCRQQIVELRSRIALA